MYYKTYRRGGQQKRRRGCLGTLINLFFRLIGIALVLALIAAIALYALPPSFLNVEPAGSQLSAKGGLPADRVNILLLGLDLLNETSQRSDAMLIASVGYDSVRLTSLMRDTVVDVPGYGRHKLNSAFAYGGPDLAMRAINQTFGLNITNYIAVDFSAMVDLVDAVGGIDLDVEERELKPLDKTARHTCVKIMQMDYDKYKHYADTQSITEAGHLHLNGLFAVSYARIRSIDSDYQRTARQRRVIAAILEKMRGTLYNPMMYVKLLDVYRNCVRTNLELWEILSLAEKLIVSGKVEPYRVPQDKYIRDNGSTIEITDLPAAANDLRKFIYGRTT